MTPRALWALLTERANHDDNTPAREEKYRDPVTTEAYILAGGIWQHDELRWVMARHNKSSRLVQMLVNHVTDSNYLLGDHLGMLLKLTGEPALSRNDLAKIAGTLGPNRVDTLRELTVAVCAHPLANSDILTRTLWDARTSSCREIAAASGNMLVAVIAWERRKASSAPQWSWLGDHSAGATELARTRATAQRWNTWAGGNPTREAFLLTASFDLEAEDDELLAICDATLALPAVS